jgi:hypothetical protein
MSNYFNHLKESAKEQEEIERRERELFGDQAPTDNFVRVGGREMSLGEFDHLQDDLPVEEEE